MDPNEFIKAITLCKEWYALSGRTFTIGDARQAVQVNGEPLPREEFDQTLIEARRLLREQASTTSKEPPQAPAKPSRRR